VIPQLLQNKDGDVSLRVWVPACATGEEAYTLGILLLEQIAAAQKNCRLQIFCDGCGRESARRRAARGLSRYHRRRRFSGTNQAFPYEGWRTFLPGLQAAARVGGLCFAEFAQRRAIFEMDLISCRNLLIYLEADIQKKIIPVLHFALNDSGYLFLGPSETTGQLDELFEPVSKKWRIYRRAGLSRPERIDLPIMLRERQSGRAHPRRRWRGRSMWPN